MARLAIRMPKMSMTMTEGEIGTWIAGVGDEIAVGDVVCEVMTDKVDMEVESTVAGTLVEIVAEEGMVPVGEPIAWVEGEDDGGGFGDLLSAPAAEAEPTTGETAEVRPADDAVVEAPTAADAPETVEERELAPAITPVVPRARALASEHALDVATISGTGPEGRVLMADVQSRIAPQPPATPAASPPVPSDRRAAVRAIVARTLAPSALVPQFTVWREIHLDVANEHRNRRSWTGVILRAYAQALRQTPELLSRWEGEGPVDSGPPAIALAVASDRGLLVPVFVEPDLASPDDLDAELREVVAAAQRGKVGSQYLSIANASLSNMGGLGVDSFQAILTPPQASILSLGSITQRPVAVPGGVGLALTVHAGLTVDHRNADGVHAARLLGDLAAALDTPELPGPNA